MRYQNLIDRIGSVVLGKEEQIRLALTCLFAGGHLLIEDLPGIGKTTLAKVLSRCLGLEFRRVQFTSDMLPGDILGVSVFRQESDSFFFHPGPVFTHVLLADEINRATPKSQSALLEAMEEGQVTVEGETRPLNDPFFVIATQNPLEQAGTYPLPESQLDRFLMRIHLGYPDRRAEAMLLKEQGVDHLLDSLDTCLMEDSIPEVREKVAGVRASDALIEYLQDIIDFTRNSSHFHMGLSPRAGLGLLGAARSLAWLEGREFVLPEDLRHVFPWVAGHRLRSRRKLTELPAHRLMELLDEVPVP